MRVPPQVSGRPRVVTAWRAALLAGLAVLLSRAAWSGWDPLRAQELLSSLCVAAAGGALVRALRARTTLAWALAAGPALWAAGSIVFTSMITLGGRMPIPSAADGFWLTSYLALYAGLTLLVRAHVRRWDAGRWLDGLVGALGTASVAAAVVVQRVLETTHGSFAVVATNVAYPLADMLLLGFVVAGLALTRLRPLGTWAWLAAGLGTLFVADGRYLIETAGGTYGIGGALDALWPLALFLVANATGRGEAPGATGADLRDHLPGAAVLFGALATAVLVYDHVAGAGSLAVALAAATLAVALARMALAFVAIARLRATESEALTDELTGLGNRRRLMRDLTRAGEATLALFDLDGFKGYNDAYGHMAGDALLTSLGHGLAEATAGHGRAYRLGGDEFCVLIDDAAVVHDHVVARALAALTQEGDGFSIGSSYGVAHLPAEAGDALQTADARMYAQKDSRRASTRRQSRDMLLQILHEQQPELEDHSTGVGDLACAVARRLGVRGDELDHVAHAAELHDVGKVAIPAAILEKPGPLDDEEWALMRRHTVIGQRILAAVPALAPVGRLVRSSHERYDGDGYPDALAGEQIPLGARVIAVCDAYSAMTTDRSYRKAMPAEDALAELRGCAGAQFDPTVVEAFAAELGAAVAAVAAVPAQGDARPHVAREVEPARGVAAAAATDIAMITRLSGLLKVSRAARETTELSELLETTCRVIAGSLGFRTVAANVVRPEHGDMWVAAVVGRDEARDELEGTAQPIALWEQLLDERFLRRGAYFMPAGESEFPEGLITHEPPVERSDDAAAWQPEDMLLVPMRGLRGELLGVVSVDEPVWGRRPGDDELEILVAVVGHAALALEHAQGNLRAARHRTAADAVVTAGLRLADCVTGAEVAATIAEGVRTGCGFERAGVELDPAAALPADALVLPLAHGGRVYGRLWVADPDGRLATDERLPRFLRAFAAHATTALVFCERLAGAAGSRSLAA